MKKYIIITIVTIALLVGVVYGISYYLSFKKVTVTVERANISADIYPDSAVAEDHSVDKNAKITTVTTSTTLSLKAGTYYVIPTTKDIDSTPTSFTIEDKDISVSINPGYSKEYLASLLPKELSTIKTVLTTKYPQLSGYTVNDGALYQDGDWYGTTIILPAPGPGASGDVYRTVLHKVNNAWQIAATPQLVLTAIEHKDIPFAVLSDLNQQTGYDVAP
jgi:hypothetical protein